VYNEDNVKSSVRMESKDSKATSKRIFELGSGVGNSEMIIHNIIKI
jgi:hypothetical protein